MISFYDKLFSIKLLIDGQDSEAFSIIPTPECKEKLSQKGLIFKANPTGGSIVVEKLGDGANPAEPLRRITEITDFVFILDLKKTGLLENLKPFKRPANTPYPSYIGRSRKLIFNNLSPANSIEDTRSDLSVLNGQVSDSDFGSVTLNKFGHVFENGAIQQVVVNELKPSGTFFPPYNLTNTKYAEFELENGAYKLDQLNGVISSETIFANANLLTQKSIGIIQIFKDQNVDYNLPVNYEIQFVTT